MRARRHNHDDSPGVILSPLIDCVFLLLIFFLVTSMIKRYERNIPVRLSDPAASVSMDKTKPAKTLGIDVNGQLYRQTGVSGHGSTEFEPVDDPISYLGKLIEQRGPTAPIELIVERQTTFQTVIHTFDDLEHVGFKNVSSRTRTAPVGEH